MSTMGYSLIRQCLGIAGPVALALASTGNGSTDAVASTLAAAISHRCIAPQPSAEDDGVSLASVPVAEARGPASRGAGLGRGTGTERERAEAVHSRLTLGTA